MEKTYLEDYQVGEVLTSPARTITEADIITYAGMTGDWHPIHTNKEFAAQSPFGERIAHGMLTLCIGSSLIYRLGQYVSLPKTFIAFYGMDKVRFVKPVLIGDTIHMTMKITALDVKDDKRGVLVAENTILNQREEPVAIYITRALVGRAPKA